MDWITFGGIVGTLGGWEAIKYLMNRKTNGRIAEATADAAEATAGAEEFKALREYNDFLQKQLQSKEERFIEAEARNRKLLDENLLLIKANAKLELEIALKRCEKKKCGDREPQNGY